MRTPTKKEIEEHIGKKPQQSGFNRPQNSNKDNSIVAQCLTKCAVELASSLVDAKVEEIPKSMPTINRIVFRSYQDFLSRLNGEVKDEK